MPTPTGGSFRNSFVAGTLGRLQQDLTLMQAAIEAKESSYTSTNFNTITDAFDSARSLLDDVQTANGDINNP